MTTAVILAGGEGKGTWPFSGVRQKVTAPVNHTPMVRRLAKDALALGIKRVVVVTGHRAEAVRACVADLDEVRFAHQQRPAGTADALAAALPSVDSEDTLVLYGDVVTPRATLKAVLDVHASRRPAVTLAVSPCPSDAPHYVSVETGPDGEVTALWGHGERGLPRFGGIALLSTDLLRRFLPRNPGIMESVPIGAMPPPEGAFEQTLEQIRADGHPLLAVEAPDFLIDVDRPWHLMVANYAAARHEVAALSQTTLGEGASIHDGADIPAGAKLFLGPGASIGKGCHIGGSCILRAGARVENGAILHAGVSVGKDTICRDYCTVAEGSVLGARGLFAHGSEFSGVAFDTVYLYHYCCITALIGNNVDIGAATVCGTWRFDEATRVQNVGGHKETPLHCGDATYLGDYCRTGVNVMFMPGVKVGSYSCIGAGAIVYEDVPERTLLLPKQEHVLKPWGPERYGW
jgi:UDP-N-acetylglucosamine diphosphorylase / glucose-1-phosphate thymidylyltransferase / UDP-N-acetylgalactosamine diphosphorylase / glucosamine-1-phosphate N-acetyltransferase / galactosamine-1-phosphate N-acetyltransferase